MQNWIDVGLTITILHVAGQSESHIVCVLHILKPEVYSLHPEKDQYTVTLYCFVLFYFLFETQNIFKNWIMII